MSLFSTSVSITRYKVEGKLETSVLETAAAVLKKKAIAEKVKMLILKKECSP